MSDFEPSPRSSKRRKTTTHGGAASAKAKSSPSVYGSVSHTNNGISRRLFKPKDQQAETDHGYHSSNVQDSASGSKEDFVSDKATSGTVNGRPVEQGSGASESADELAHSGVTVTPTKLERNASRGKAETSKTARQADKPGDADHKPEDTPIQTRSSGRERKRPRRFSSSWENRPQPALPKGILTPSRKGQKGSRKSVVFEQNEAGVEDELGFKDLGKTAQKKTKRSRREKEPSSVDVAHGQPDNHVYQGVNGDEEADEALVEGVSNLRVPELPDVDISALIDPSPAITDSRLDVAKSLVLSRLTGSSLTPLTNLEVEYSKLHSLLSATIKVGEGNSILLLGSRGAGKSCLVESAIAELAIEHAEDFHVVRLNGFLQTDDKLALREIWRQLGREMQIQEDETAQVSSYADTMASLLHLLSHPEELAETLEPDAATRTTKSVIFVLDEFDLFTTHPRQTLLYNLFDIAQARKAPIAVVGCSARVDVSDNLEKRVKSRFSHRWIHLPQAKSLPVFEDIAKAALLLREQDKDHVGHSTLKKMRRDWNALIEVGTLEYY
jgi:origin recognition complex subunit 4